MRAGYRATMSVILIIILVALVSISFIAYRSVTKFDPEGVAPLEIVRQPPPSPTSDRLDLLLWNIGYAGLGADSDFKADGGESLLPKSRAVVETNLDGITSFLSKSSADLFLFQEVAFDSRLTRSVDVRSRLDQLLQDCSVAYAPTISVRGFPVLGNLIIGNATYSRLRVDSARRVCLPLAQGRVMGLFKQHFNAVEVRLSIPGTDREWVIINHHLSAFDDEGAVRKSQMAFLRDYMIEQFEAGHHVVVGGDWNHRLTETSFPHTTDEQYLFWLIDLPRDFTPPGWSWGFDPSHPTVRTLHKPYVAGENYVTIIDGFLVSPNVAIEEVRGFDLGFTQTDHQPVSLRVRAKNAP